jgi:hypothetical protein
LTLGIFKSLVPSIATEPTIHGISVKHVAGLVTFEKKYIGKGHCGLWSVWQASLVKCLLLANHWANDRNEPNLILRCHQPAFVKLN